MSTIESVLLMLGDFLGAGVEGSGLNGGPRMQVHPNPHLLFGERVFVDVITYSS